MPVQPMTDDDSDLRPIQHALAAGDIDLDAVARTLRAAGYVCMPIAPYLCPPATAAAILIREVRTLKQWRTEGKGPTPYSAGGRVSYLLADVLQHRLSGLKPDW